MSIGIAFCDYCGASERKARWLMASPSNPPAPAKLLVHICDECVDRCQRIFAERKGHPMADAMRQAWRGEAT